MSKTIAKSKYKPMSINIALRRLSKNLKVNIKKHNYTVSNEIKKLSSAQIEHISIAPDISYANSILNTAGLTIVKEFNKHTSIPRSYQILSTNKVLINKKQSLNNWVQNNDVQLKNIKESVTVILEKHSDWWPHAISPLIYYKRKLIGSCLIFINDNQITIDELYLLKEDRSIGSTIFKWLALQAKIDNKNIKINFLVKDSLVHIAFKYLKNIRVRMDLSNIWEVKSEKELIKHVNSKLGFVYLIGVPNILTIQ